MAAAFRTDCEGFHRRDGALVYVTRGVGTSFLPFRFLCRPEVVLFRFLAARPGVLVTADGRAGTI